MSIEQKKTAAYKKNEQLEILLNKLNDSLVNLKDYLPQSEPKYPVIFVVGVPRSGTTLLTQWLASLDLFCYPSNFLSRFYKAPYIGALIQEMLFNDKYDYKNELNINTNKGFFYSDSGKTTGALEPHEFWYFWRRFFDFPDIPVSLHKFIKNAKFNDFKNEIAGIQSVFNKPFFIKALIINSYILSFNENMNNAIFLYIKRNLTDNVNSILNTRIKYFDDKNEWYSFKPHNYKSLKNLNSYNQVTGQVNSLNQEISESLSKINKNKYLEIDYDDFCHSPKQFYFKLSELLKKYRYKFPENYKGPEKFIKPKKQNI